MLERLLALRGGAGASGGVKGGWLLCLGSDCLMQRDNNNNASSQIHQREATQRLSNFLHVAKKSFSFLSFIAGFMIKWFQTVRPWCLGNRTFHSASHPRQNSTSTHLHCMQKCKWKHAATVALCHLCTLVFIHLRLLAPGRIQGSH